MTNLDPVHLIVADMLAIKHVMIAMLDEVLTRSPDRKTAAEALLHHALNHAERQRVDGVSPDMVDSMRDAMGERISAMFAAVLQPRPRVLD